MRVIKRNGVEVNFDSTKIENAISKANNAMLIVDQLSEKDIHDIAEAITNDCGQYHKTISVEDIQDMVENYIMDYGKRNLAKAYVKYRYEHQLSRQTNTTDEKILSIINNTSEEVKQENSNKNPQIVSVMRDYMAGEVSRDLTSRKLFPADVLAAHNSGEIHGHDTDYFIQPISNCCLVNLEDMLQNGTVISSTMIEKPHMFSTACNITTQIVAQVASSQYGGQTFTLTHLAPFVEESRKKFIKEVTHEFEECGFDVDAYRNQILKIAEERTKKDIAKGVQILQYQVITLMTTNG